MRDADTPDDNGWYTGMDDAPQDEKISVIIPDLETGEPEQEYAYWDHANDRWEGEWRHVVLEDGETPHPIAAAEPTHWKPLDWPVEFEIEAEVELRAAVPGH